MAETPIAPPASGAGVDSITVEVIRHSLLASAQEMARNLCRTAYNTVVYEIHDYGIGIHDAGGNVVADTPGIAIFTGANDFGVQNTVKFLGRETLRPGDVYLLNYPYWSCAHTLDALVFAPVFSGDEVIAFASCRVHLLDLKQKDAGYVLDSTDMAQEGIFFPGTKVFSEGKLNRELIEIIRFNSRMPERTIGDLLAQASAVQTGDRQVREIAARYGAGVLVEAMREINDHGERLARAALATLPKGSWSAVDYCDTDGVVLDELVKMEVEVTITDEAMIVDWTRTDLGATGPINLPRGLTVAAAMMTFKALTTPDTPVCGGNFRPLEVITTPGSLMEAVPPMPTFTLWPGLLAPEVITKALAKGMPDRVPACSGGDVCDVMALGVDPRTNTFWNEATNDAVGFGASARGDGEDGIMHITEPGARNNPIEVLETKAPLLIERYGFRPDSAGPGKHRGGVGVERSYRFLAPTDAIVINYKTRTRPWSIGEGVPGQKNTVVVHPGTPEEREVGQSRTSFGAGGRIVNLTGGGGGWGDPFERDPSLVAHDVAEGLVSIDHAAEAYGVVIEASSGAPDTTATAALRKRRGGDGAGGGGGGPA
ncbi:MAG TPA: hydantoinase B/oxoprolinase family protein [Acidimicrobiales bacterium]|nr:hydantoinase B/oxoprolinase family protein [Acidimicrobiales bacterium]